MLFRSIKHQLLADRFIANTFVGFDPISREELYNEDDQFLTLATHIVTEQRRSQNNLKKNFIEYKTKTGWNPILIEKNEDYYKSGSDSFSLGKHLENEAFSEKVITATPISERKFKRLFTIKLSQFI